MIKEKYILILIIGIAIFLRFFALGKVPISPDWDEAALGYNAYSIMQTGRDEYGKFLPVVLRSFDDYKPALYAYFAIPFIKIFGLSVFSVRFPSALFGTLTIIATYFVVKLLFEENKHSNSIAGVTAFLLAISPWHIQFSRIGFESNVGLALNVLAVLSFLIGIKKEKFFILTSCLMAINLYMYQSEKVFAPLIVLVLLLTYREKVFSSSKKVLMLSVFLGLVLLIPLIVFTVTNKEAFARAKGVSVFSDQTNFLKKTVLRIEEDKSRKDYLGLILDNRRIEYAKSVFSGYISHFDFNWLFLKGDIARHHAPDMGLLYLWELPFLLIGFYKLVFWNFSKKSKWLIFSWFFLAPIPASITSGVPHAVRTLNFLPTFQIITAIGVISIFSTLSKIRYNLAKIQIKYGLCLILITFVLFNFIHYLNQYFVQQNYFNASEWQYGYEKIFPYIEKNQSHFKKVVVSNQAPMDQSYMFFLFYLQYSPSLYQRETQGVSGGFRENHKFGIFEFRPISWAEEKKDKSVLFVGRPGDFPDDINPIYRINYPNGNAAIKLMKIE